MLEVTRESTTAAGRRGTTARKSSRSGPQLQRAPRMSPARSAIAMIVPTGCPVTQLGSRDASTTATLLMPRTNIVAGSVPPGPSPSATAEVVAERPAEVHAVHQGLIGHIQKQPSLRPRRVKLCEALATVRRRRGGPSEASVRSAVRAVVGHRVAALGRGSDNAALVTQHRLERRAQVSGHGVHGPLVKRDGGAGGQPCSEGLAGRW